MVWSGVGGVHRLLALKMDMCRRRTAGDNERDSDRVCLPREHVYFVSRLAALDLYFIWPERNCSHSGMTTTAVEHCHL